MRLKFYKCVLLIFNLLKKFVPCSNGKLRNGVEVGPQHLRIAEHFVTESVEAVECDPDVGGCDPFLYTNDTHLKNLISQE